MGKYLNKSNLALAALAYLGIRVATGFATDKTGNLVKAGLGVGGALVGVIAAKEVLKA